MIGSGRRALERQVAEWQEHGVVDAATAARILAHGADGGHRPMPGILVMIGGFALALGIAALVSANWDQIPVAVRLGAHLLLTAALALAAWVRAGQGAGGEVAGGRPDPGLEALLLLLSASSLALIAHVGQSYNLQGGPEGMLGFWLLIASPFTLALARSGFNRWPWTAGLVAFLGFWLEAQADALHDARLLTAVAVLPGLVAYAAPLIARTVPLDRGWADHLRRCALAALLTAISLAQLGWYLDGTETGLRAASLDILIGALVAAAGLALITLWERGMAALADPVDLALVIAPLAGVLPFAVAAVAGGADSMWVAAASFCLIWLAVAKLALDRQAAGLFRLAVVLVALRLVVVFLEAAGGLIATGAGLVLAGLLLIAVGAVTRRILRWAEREGEAGR